MVQRQLIQDGDKSQILKAALLGFQLSFILFTPSCCLALYKETYFLQQSNFFAVINRKTKLQFKQRERVYYRISRSPGALGGQRSRPEAEQQGAVPQAHCRMDPTKILMFLLLGADTTACTRDPASADPQTFLDVAAPFLASVQFCAFWPGYI